MGKEFAVALEGCIGATRSSCGEVIRAAVEGIGSEAIVLLGFDGSKGRRSWRHGSSAFHNVFVFTWSIDPMGKDF